MREWPIEAADLLTLQDNLRKAFIRILDRTNTVFSELAAQFPNWPDQSSLPYAGEALRNRLDEKKDKTAVIVVDAFRFEPGKRLAELINTGQAAPVATVAPCMAPVPTTTEPGMAYALPGFAKNLRVSVDSKKGWTVYAEGFDRNLAVAGSRRNWLTTMFGVKSSHILSISDAFKAGVKLPAGKLIFLFGEIDGNCLGRQILVKVRDVASGKMLFKSDAIPANPRDDLRQIRLENIRPVQ